MDNAGVEYTLVDVEQDAGEAPKTVENQKQKLFHLYLILLIQETKLKKQEQHFKKKLEKFQQQNTKLNLLKQMLEGNIN